MTTQKHDAAIMTFSAAGKNFAEGLFIREAASPNPPISQTPSFKMAGVKRAKKNAAQLTLIQDEPKEQFEEVNLQNYRKAWLANPVLYWGPENLFPFLLDKEAQQCDTLEAGLKRVSDHLYGQGFYLYRDVFKNGQREVEEVDEPEIYDMLYNSGYHEYYAKACKELPRWGNIFPVYLLNEQHKIVQIKLYDVPFCRLERPDFKSGRIEAVYVSGQWEHGLVVTSAAVLKDTFLKKWVKRFPLLDENFYHDQLTEEENVYTWCQHLKYHTSGKAYGRAPWHSAYFNRWTALSAAVPEMKMRLFEYAMTINYMVYIDEEYWRSKYGNEWEDWEVTERQAKITEKQREIEKYLSGKDNAWKTLFSSKIHDSNGNDVKTIIIEAIDNRLKEGTYIPDSQIADVHILQALGVDPTLMGVGGNSPGGKQSAGSGSNIREASLSLNAILRPDRELINTAYYVMRDLNFPDKKDIKIGVRDYVINTLDGRSPTSGAEAVAK